VRRRGRIGGAKDALSVGVEESAAKKAEAVPVEKELSR